MKSKKLGNKRKYIYTVTVLKDLNIPSGRRCFGWFSNPKKAKEAVERNGCDIHECLYMFAVVERFEDGLYSISRVTWWYKWNEKLKCYEPIEKPEEVSNRINFGIG